MGADTQKETVERILMFLKQMRGLDQGRAVTGLRLLREFVGEFMPSDPMERWHAWLAISQLCAGLSANLADPANDARWETAIGAVESWYATFPKE